MVINEYIFIDKIDNIPVDRFLLVITHTIIIYNAPANSC